MITFDDIPEATVTGSPIEENDKPTVGGFIKDKRILRVKPVSATEITKLVLNDSEVSESLLFERHKSRPFVFWLVEIE